MNPYNTLKALGAFNAIYGTIIRKNGERISLLVKAETVDDEQFQGTAYPGSVKVRKWSAAYEDFKGEVNLGEGDVLEITNDDGTSRKLPITRDANSTRYWDWKYKRAGYRVVFWTRY